jgi:hypothetical protein
MGRRGGDDSRQPNSARTAEQKRLHCQLDSTRHRYIRELAVQRNDLKTFDYRGKEKFLHLKALDCSVLFAVSYD